MNFIRLKRLAFRALLQILMTGLFLPPVWAQATVGTVSALTGTVQLSRNSRSSPANVGLGVQMADRFTTGPASSLNLTMADNSRLDLGEQTSLVIDQMLLGPAGRQSTRLSLLSGQVTSLVTAALRSSAPDFQVQTPNAVAAVRGTKFSVTFARRSAVCGYRDSTDVAVYQGVVSVSSRANPTSSILVYSGQETVVCGPDLPLAPGPLGLAGMNPDSDSFYGLNPGTGGAPPPVCPVCPGHC